MIRLRIVLVLLTISCNIFAQSADEAFKPSGKPIVQIFSVALYNTTDNLYSFKFNRAHLGYQYQFSPDWSAKIIIDGGRATSVETMTVTTTDGTVLAVDNSSSEGANYTMYLKFASLRWEVNEQLTLEGGAILQNHYITQERFWGLRYVAQTFQDLYWKIPSSDLGFMAIYKLNNIISIDAAITNGEGPRKIQDAFGKVKLGGGININLSERIQARIFYHNRQSRTSVEETEQLYSFFAGYKPIKKLHIGGEFNYVANLNNTNNMNSYGFSIYSVYQLSSKTELFARYDRLLNEVPVLINAVDNQDGNTIMGGICYAPVQGVNISLNYQGWLTDESTNMNKNNILLSMEYKF